MKDPPGTLGAHAGSRRIAAGHFPKALGRNLWNVEHDRMLPFLDPTLGEVLGDPHSKALEVFPVDLPIAAMGFNVWILCASGHKSNPATVSFYS